MDKPTASVKSLSWRANRFTAGERTIPEETAVSFTYGGSSYAVMMATPEDLRDFAVGFSLNEGIIESASEVENFEIIELPNGIELRMRLSEPHAKLFSERKRYLAGPTGCGLCGLDSLTEATRQPKQISADDFIVSPTAIFSALATLSEKQVIHEQTRAVHGAAFFNPDRGLIALREDIGRHNALDKLVGALAHLGEDPRFGFGIVSSRLSIEMVQKAAAIGLPILVAVSAPSALAVRAAKAAGMTLVAVARADGFEIFSHPDRIEGA